MNDSQDTIYWVWLSRLFWYGSEKANEIRKQFASLRDFYELTSEQMRDLEFLTERDVKSIKEIDLDVAQEIIDKCISLKIDIVTFADESYPNRLRVIYGPPMVLYKIGDISGIDESVAITIVGTRNASEYTETATEFLAFELAKTGVIVISGCAVGIDTAAHRGALKANGRTIGVLGCGLDVNYPAANRDLKVRILKKGALITEMPPGTAAIGRVFPVRNRILAALSLGVLVTHAPMRSGSLITAEHGLEQGKNIFCLPPFSIFDFEYFGVVKYIRDGAIPVFSVADIISEYSDKYADKLDFDDKVGDYIAEKRPEKPRVKRVENANKTIKNKAPLDEPLTQETIEEKLQIIRENNKLIIESFDDKQFLVYNKLTLTPKYIDEISNEASLSVGDALCALTELEMMGIAESLAGRRYALCNV